MLVKSPYAEERVCPWLDDRVVQPGEVVPVPDAQLDHWLEAGWTPADDRTLAAARELDAARVERGKTPRLPAPEPAKKSTKAAAEAPSTGEGE